MTKIKDKKPLLNSRMEMTGNRISKLEDGSIECIQSEEQRKNRLTNEKLQ